ncbi:2TM domain-containing protein [Mesohalobacter halotolerans]|uniref:2TM domain-containing protein n=1 Tax=Mesohalobacter halotolerans TaxID=1883405 RepID=A0A4U5TU57_9FLAO|nr:2TM domain-containing protein [Mesohalobacter halotolerans]MBS3737452.1 2TM domain-containing protein [Psychroflexus sp.]TKS57034.1 2TM domain-containing protein [Mesohalobacter halotolerans]
MASSKDIDIDQKELFKNANRRIKQKKRLVHHFVFFIAGAVVLIFINLVLEYQIDFRPLGWNWFVSAILIWAFFIIAHAINVFFVEKLMGRAWEEEYMYKLVEKQLVKLKKLQKKVDKKYPLEEDNQNQNQQDKSQSHNESQKPKNT